MSRIFTEQKSNANKDPYFRFFAFDLCLWVHLIMNIYFSQLMSSNGPCAGASRYKNVSRNTWFSFNHRRSVTLNLPQIRFRPGLRPGPRWRSSRRSPRPPSWLGRGILGREYPRGYPSPNSTPLRLRRLDLGASSRISFCESWQPYAGHVHAKDERTLLECW